MALRVTLVVAFGYFAQRFGIWWEPTNDILLLFECSLSSYDAHRWWGYSSSTCCNLICLHFLHSQALEVLKHPLTPSHAHSHRATWWIFHLLIFLLKYSFLSLQLVPLLAEDLINFDPPDGKIYIVALGNLIKKHSATKFNNYSINSGMCEQ